MGDREDPARLVFTSKTGPGIATSLVDLGDRFRLLINEVECKKTEKPMPGAWRAWPSPFAARAQRPLPPDPGTPEFQPDRSRCGSSTLCRTTSCSMWKAVPARCPAVT